MLRKYPRTPHLAGSRLQPGDFDLAAVGFREIAGAYLVVEEKLDGANAAVSFDADGALRLQSRGHYLTGGPRERQFAPFKAWAATVADALRPVLGDRYVLYGEWLYAKHTVFYDALPHYFCEFDVYDRAADAFLSTRRRRELLAGLPAAGKDHWIAGHRAGRPVVSLDALRAELRVAPTGDQGPVVAAAYRLAREHLAAGRPFVWNATNLTRRTRQRCVGLIAEYRCRAELVSLEAPPQVLRERNAARDRPVPESVVDRWETPDPTEAHIVTWVTT